MSIEQGFYWVRQYAFSQKGWTVGEVVATTEMWIIGWDVEVTAEEFDEWEFGPRIEPVPVTRAVSALRDAFRAGAGDASLRILASALADAVDGKG